MRQLLPLLGVLRRLSLCFPLYLLCGTRIALSRRPTQKKTNQPNLALNPLMTPKQFVACVMAFNDGDFSSVLTDASELELELLAELAFS
jgi:hypothetical protein